jgi:hypothetical protein
MSTNPQEASMATSFKVEVQTDNTGKWYGNACRYTTEAGAKIAGQDLCNRWLLVRDWRAVESDEPANYEVIDQGGVFVVQAVNPPQVPA